MTGPLQRWLDGDASIIGKLNSGYHSPFGDVVGPLVDLTEKAKVNTDVGRLKVVSAILSAENGRHSIGVELAAAERSAGVTKLSDDAGHKIVLDKRSIGKQPPKAADIV